MRRLGFYRGDDIGQTGIGQNQAGGRLCDIGRVGNRDAHFSLFQRRSIV